MSEEQKFQRFGKYLILDHLVDGGMAKICRARYLGEQANKVVAIKMVQQQFSNDEAFVRMFQDELNITFGMLHPNIMQVYDYGKTNGQLYTAMEYIHGANLKQYLDRLKEKKVVFPVEISCYIISQVCLGLHYAHTFTDKLTGKPYNIVHRDISPHNIMLTYDGAVKVIDFGIAKANTNSEATQAGTIKGKLSYLAPEYLDGLELDARYDEFAVGITLWELLCSRKLFQAPNDLAVLKQIQACKIAPPSTINPSVPKELDAIVMKALSKDRANRYENLDQMNRALVRFLYSQYPDFNASDLSTFAEDLFKSEIASDRIKFVDYGKLDTLKYIEEMKNEENGKGPAATKKEIIKVGKQEERVKSIELEMNSNYATGIDLKPDLEKTGTRRLPKGLSVGVKGAPGRPSRSSSGGGTMMKSRDRTSSRLITRKDLASAEESAEASSSRKFLFILIAGSLAAISYFNPQLTQRFGFNLHSMIHGTTPESNDRVISSIPKNKDGSEQEPADGSAPTQTAELKTGKIFLKGVDVSMEVFVDGIKYDYVGSPLIVEMNKDITVLVKKVGHVPYTNTMSLNKERTSAVFEVPDLERARNGLLTTSMNYTAGSKLIYTEAGQTVELDLPFRDLQIPEGKYRAKIVNPILGTEKKVEFLIEENRKHFLE